MTSKWQHQAGVAAAIEADTVASTEAEAETAPAKPSLRPRQLLPRSERKAGGTSANGGSCEGTEGYKNGFFLGISMVNNG